MPHATRLARMVALTGAAGLLAMTAASAQPDLAARFGQRPAIEHMSMSPDGTQVATVSAAGGRGTLLMVTEANEGAKARIITGFRDGQERINWCRWASNSRLVCSISAIISQTGDLLPVSRLIAIDTRSGATTMLSTRQGLDAQGVQLYGGTVIDWLPAEDDAVLMARVHVPEGRTGSRIGKSADGLGVDRIDARTGAATRVEPARRDAAGFITDGRGNVRLMATVPIAGATGQMTSRLVWYHRPANSRSWERLGETDRMTGDGFRPVAVDPDSNIAYGFQKVDGRQAVHALALDGSNRLSLVFAHPEVDVDGLVRVGRDRRVVGASFATDRRQSVYFDPEIERLKTALARALPGNPAIRIVDSSLDGRRLLIEASKDRDPGVTYILDRDSNRLQTFLVTHPALEGLALAEMRPVTYRASDGTLIPAYLTLPPGRETAKGLPAIVMPHGGPSARDEWGFDWLPQFFAARGYAVLQPNFRGSAGYGEEWLQVNGFQSWRTAIGDVADAGRWLVAEGIADPRRLAVVGWSYGGYAALQSAVTEPDLFRAVVAIAPVTDLARLIEERRGWTDRAITRDFIGTGPHLREGSPAQNAERIRAPVLLFHGTHDLNVGVGQSRLMASRLERAGVPHELVIFDRLEHSLPDSEARARLLRESDAFLQRAFGPQQRAARD